MTAIPNRISILDKHHTRVAVLERVGEKEFTEADYDRVIVENADVIADTLRQSGVIEQGSELHEIATQFECIDVLFAECRGDELVRLVVVEDKLFRNPEQHRQVLAQLLDYAHRLQYSVDIDALIARAPQKTRDILQGDRETLARVLRTGDLLLLVVGDRVQPRLIELMKPLLDRRAGLLSRLEMGLLSLALYRRGDELVLVPNVVGVIARGERDISIIVQCEAGHAVPARVGATEPGRSSEPTTRLPGPAWTRETFLAQTCEDLAPDHEKTVGTIERLLDLAARRPLAIRWGRGKTIGTFTILARSPTGDVALLNVDSNGGLQIYALPISEVLGDEATKREIAALGSAMDAPIRNSPYPYLPSELAASGDERRITVLEAWLRRLADAITSHPTS